MIYCIKILILDKLSVTCRNIRILHIDYYIINHDVDNSLFKLIEEQNQIKGSHIIANGTNLDYQKILRNGEHNLDSLISKYQTLKPLELYYYASRKINLILLKLQKVCLDVEHQLFLPDFIGNINILKICHFMVEQVIMNI